MKPKISTTRPLLRRAPMLAAASTIALFAATAPSIAQTVVVANAMDIESTDPSREWSVTSLMVLNTLYDTLTAFDVDGVSLVPGLAESWEVADNNTRFTFNISDDAVFSDGSPVEAKDVEFTLTRSRNLGVAGFLYEGITEMNAPDPKTIEIVLSEGNIEFPALLASSISGIMNRDLVMENGGTTDPTTDQAEGWLLTQSAGSGPFILESFDPGNSLIITRNENYWGEAPAFDRMVMQNVQNPTAQALLLETGDADIALGLDSASADTIGNPNVVITKAQGADTIYMVLAPGAPDTNGQLTAEVREAIVSAIDFQGIVDDLADGAGRIQPSLIPLDYAGGSGLDAPTRDVEKARALLEEGGFADGVDLTVSFIEEVSFGINQNLLLQKVQQDLAEAGIRLTLNPVAEPIIEEMRANGTAPISIFGWGPDYAGVVPYVTSMGLYEGTWVADTAALNDVDEAQVPQTPELLNSALAAEGAEFEGIMREISELTMEKNVIIPLINPDVIRAHVSSVENFSCQYIYNCRFSSITLN